MIGSKVKSLEALQEKTEHDLRVLLPAQSSDEDVRRLSRALKNLRRFTDILRRDAHSDDGETALHWDSWDSQRMAAIPSPRYKKKIVLKFKPNFINFRLSRSVWMPEDGVFNNNHEAQGCF